MEPATVAAVQATPVFCDRDATIEKVGVAARRKRPATAPAWSRSPRVSCPPIPTGCGGRRRGPIGSGTPVGSTRPSTCPGPACDALGAIAREHECYLAIPGERARRRHGLQHAPLLRSRRELARQAPQAGRDRRRATRVGLGRRLDAHGDRHAVRPGRRVDLLGELHAARARRHVRAGHRRAPLAHVDNSDVWPLSMQHIAKEGRCYVVGITSCQRGPTCRPGIPGRDEIYGDDDDWMSRGNSIIVDPFGHVLAGPLVGEPGILYADIDADGRSHVATRVRRGRATTRGPTCSNSA